MENNNLLPAKNLAFFVGMRIKKFNIDDFSICPLDYYYTPASCVYMVDEPVRLLAGDKDATRNIELEEGDMFITLSKYNNKIHEYEYYRFPIESESLREFMIEQQKKEKEESESVNSVEKDPQPCCDCGCECA